MYRLHVQSNCKDGMPVASRELRLRELTLGRIRKCFDVQDDGRCPTVMRLRTMQSVLTQYNGLPNLELIQMELHVLTSC